jgi:acyl-CoA synthetase (AMP-forming)/AMP-acid ligase II
MLHQAMMLKAKDGGQAVVTDGGAVCWYELARWVDQLCHDHEHLRSRRVGLCLDGSALGLAVLAALERLSCDAFVLAGDLPLSTAILTGQRYHLGAVLMPGVGEAPDQIHAQLLPGEDVGSGQAVVTILTSGSEGQPKAVRHTWSSLARPVRVGSQAERPRWLLTYRPHLYAGLQVVLQCLLNLGTLVVPQPRGDAQGVALLAADAGVQYASATPSYWRWLLTFADSATLSRIPLVQVTLGGEVVSQQILDSLERRFPAARRVHIYATTELGRCFSVTDSRAGFPASFLDRPSPDGVEMRIDEGELLVRSANAMEGYDECAPGSEERSGWFRTGDLVERHDDRVLFNGRKSEIINVGGNKVHPLEVERIIRAIPGVADTRVFGSRSSIAGQIVACEVVVAEGFDPDAVSELVNRQCLAALATHQRPRLVTVVDRIILTEAGKAVRSSAQ